jgi:hypothetical protein
MGSAPLVLSGPADLGKSTATPEPQLLELGPDLTVYIGAERDARFIYKEIYQDHCYDIAPLPPNPCMLFSLVNYTSSGFP